MLIRPHDAGTEQEWKALLARHRFGLLIAPGRDRELPVVVPTHVAYDGRDRIRLHLARPNPIWMALDVNPACMFTVVSAFTYVPTSWEAPPGTAPEWGIPTSHYATVQLECTARITDDETEIRQILSEQLGVMQPDQPYGDPTSQDAPYPTELRQIRGLELRINAAKAKFKFDGAEPDDVRRRVVDGYEQRRGPGDQEASEHLTRRHPTS
jgi:transcriptional regulator